MWLPVIVCTLPTSREKYRHAGESGGGGVCVFAPITRISNSMGSRTRGFMRARSRRTGDDGGRGVERCEVRSWDRQASWGDCRSGFGRVGWMRREWERAVVGWLVGSSWLVGFPVGLWPCGLVDLWSGSSGSERVGVDAVWVDARLSFAFGPPPFQHWRDWQLAPKSRHEPETGAARWESPAGAESWVPELSSLRGVECGVWTDGAGPNGWERACQRDRGLHHITCTLSARQPTRRGMRLTDGDGWIMDGWIGDGWKGNGRWDEAMEMERQHYTALPYGSTVLDQQHANHHTTPHRRRVQC